MKKSFMCFFAAILCFPLYAFSAVINIEYSARISSTSGDGFGYSIGDMVSGSAVIDLSKIEGHNFELDNEIWVYGAASGSLVRSSNYKGGAVGDTINMVRIIDQAEPIYDFLDLSEVLSVSGPFLDSFQLGFYLEGLDWITGTSGNNIKLIVNDPALLSQSFGRFTTFDSTDWSVVNSAFFSLESVSVISASVPEPTPLALLLVALALVTYRNKFQRN